MNVGSVGGKEYAHVSVDQQYTVKKVIDFTVPSRDVTDQTFPDREN